MNALRLLRRLPAHALNGIGVALGVALLQISVGAIAGHAAALAASSAAVCTSLADVPNATHRTWHRVLTAALVTSAVSLLVGATRAHPLLLGLVTALIALCSAMTLAWGMRAGPISFAGILAYVFALATPPIAGAAPLLAHAGWSLLGAMLYVGWATASSALLQGRYRRLALASVLGAIAQLLRSRAALLMQEPGPTGPASPLQERIRADAVLDERLQAARDLLFAARDDDGLAQRQTALLLLAIDLRDTLLASELDLDLLGHDAAGARVRDALAANLGELAGALAAMHEALRESRPLPKGVPVGGALHVASSDALLPAGDARTRLVPVLLDRSRHMVVDIERMQAILSGGDARPPLQRSELQLFVTVEGWPLASLRPHANLRSPITRHALRSAAALSSAYFIAQVLPWSSHPYWLVLSVAVVLRGNLEQTLSRRNARIAGTVIGCLIVLALGQLGLTWLATLIFLTAVGVAHAYVNQQYLVTAAAASVMALLQAHLAQPLNGYAVSERLADTVLGALLAWAFSYVLPAWERRALPRVVARLLKALGALSRQTLHWPDGAQGDVALRLARREAYDALGSVATAAQRTSVEPQSVRVPLYALASLLGHSHALLAHLAAVKLLLARRAGELDRHEAEAALQEAAADVNQRLTTGADASSEAPTDAEPLPAEPASDALMPWLRRRLQLARASAARVAHAARALHAAAGV